MPGRRRTGVSVRAAPSREGGGLCAAVSPPRPVFLGLCPDGAGRPFLPDLLPALLFLTGDWSLAGFQPVPKTSN